MKTVKAVCSHLDYKKYQEYINVGYIPLVMTLKSGDKYSLVACKSCADGLTTEIDYSIKRSQTNHQEILWLK